MHSQIKCLFLIIALSLTSWAQSGVGGNSGIGGNSGLQTTGFNSVFPATYYVSTSGSDTNTGAFSSPYASVGKAQTSLRSLPCTAPHTVYIRNGTYYGTALTFTSLDSYTATCPVTYQSYPGETAVLSAGRQLTGWTQVTTGTCAPAHALGNTCWQTTIPNTSNYFETLFYNGNRRMRPRIYASAGALQGTGYAHVSCTSSAPNYPNCATGSLSNNLTYSTADATAIAAIDSGSISQGHVELTAFDKWTAQISIISSITTGSKTIALTCTTSGNCPPFLSSDGPGPPYTNGFRFTIENFKAGLQFPGQWFLDTSTSPNWTISYVSNSGENPPTDTIVAGNNPSVIQTTAGSGVTISNTSFIGLQFMHDNVTIPATGYVSRQNDPNLSGALVQCNGCVDVIFAGDVFAHTTGTALQFTGSSSADQVGILTSGNAFFDAGAYPIQLGVTPSATSCSGSCADSSVPNNITVTQNWIDYNSRFFPSADGIMFGLTNHDTITNNDIGYGYDKGIEGCLPTNNCAQGSTSLHNMYVANNHIHNIGQGVMTDLAAIYMATTGSTNVLANNLLHDVNGSAIQGDTMDTGVHGVYLDGFTCCIFVQNNVIYRVMGDLVHMNHGPQSASSQNTITNNILVNTANYPSAPAKGCVGIQTPNVSYLSYIYTHNICSQDQTASKFGNAGTGPPSSGTAAQQQFVQNLYSFAGTPSFNVAGSQVNFAAWQGTYGEDTTGTISTNPGFKAPSPCANTIPQPTCDNFTFTNGTGPGFGFVYTPETYGPTVTIAIPVIAPTFPEATLPVTSF